MLFRSTVLWCRLAYCCLRFISYSNYMFLSFAWSQEGFQSSLKLPLEVIQMLLHLLFRQFHQLYVYIIYYILTILLVASSFLYKAFVIYIIVQFFTWVSSLSSVLDFTDKSLELNFCNYSNTFLEVSECWLATYIMWSLFLVFRPQVPSQTYFAFNVFSQANVRSFISFCSIR